MAKIVKNYSIGLDIGSASVGWAVVDNNYHLLKFKGKNMYGSRLFEEGQTAQDTRIARNSRRRIARRRQRITLLRELIGNMVYEKDTQFFVHLDKSYLTVEDKQFKFNLFNDKDYNDQHFHEQYPTIYHLRKDLCTNKEKADPRFVYLALHHILKYRGNFLYEGQKFEITNDSQAKTDLKEALSSILKQHDVEIFLSEELIDTIMNTLVDYKLKKGSKKDHIIECLVQKDKDVKKAITEVCNLLMGYESNLTKLFPEANIQKEDKDYKTNFDSTKYEDDISFIETSLQGHFEALQQLHNVYSFIVLQGILKGESYICDAMINKYTMHNQDLKELKSFIKQYYSLTVYNEIFREEKIKGNYYNYINNPRTTTRQDFYDFIKKTLIKNNDITDNETYLKILDKMEREEYFLRQNAKDNGTIPYQMHEKEFVQIIENQKQYYPALAENKDKLLSILHFRIPYYVGPLNEKSKFAWIERKHGVKLTPWNFEDNVNVIESAEKFIRQMTNRCTYILSEDVVPKCSLLYQRFEVLNELNKIRVVTTINEKPQLLSLTLKEGILNDIFLEKKKVREKDIIDYLIRKQVYGSSDIIEIKGMQKENEFASSLTSWIDFKNIYKENFESSFTEIEKIIEWVSVYEDKKILKKRIEAEMPHMNDKVNIISKLRYSGWGRLSKKLLCEIKTKTRDGEYISIMDCLETTSLNFMQIINDKTLEFGKQIEEENQIEDTNKITYDMVKELQGSPAIKKAIWQTVKIIEEITKVMKSEPENIFIEFARSDEESKRSISKVKKLQDIYNILKKDGVMSNVAKEAFQYLSKEDKSKKMLEEKLYLYYLQEGKCLYSGEALNIHNLKEYQVDHILPQSYIKDDSIDNKALVLAKENQYKGDNLLLSPTIVQKQKTWWEHLRKYNLISDKKHKNLTRIYMNEREEMSFINRQLVETRQITKHVANLLQQQYSQSKIVAIKASLSSIFREKFDLFKVRDINDYHHAQDAYLSTVIGTFVLKKYPALQNEFIFSEYMQLKNFKKDLAVKRNKFGFIINQMGQERIIQKETGEVIWDGNNTLSYILKVFEFKDCFITKKVEEKRGQLFDLTIPKLNDLKATLESTPHKVIPVNKTRSDVQRYGGFTGLKYAYGIAVEYKVKNKMKRTIFNAPRHLLNNQLGLYEFVKKEAGVDEVFILKDKILLNQLFEFEGGLYTMASASEWHNARQLLLSKKVSHIVYHLLNGDVVTTEELADFYDEYLDKLSIYYPLMKNVCQKLKDSRNSFLNSQNHIKIVRELLKITKGNPSYSNIMFDDFKISSSAGRITNKTFDLNKTELITQSITGLYTQRFKL